MKLSKLTIKNFRGINGENNAISFDGSDIIFLIGQNNVGKSSFLRAYEFFVTAKQKALKEDFFNHVTSKSVEIEAEFIVNPDVDKKDMELQIDGKGSDPQWMAKWMSFENKVKIRKVWKKEDGDAEKETYDPVKGNWVDNGFGGFDTLITKYAPTPISINAMETEASLEEKINKLISDELLKKAKDNFKIPYDVALEAVKKLEKDMLASDQIKIFNQNINRRFKEVFSDLELTISSKGDSTINLMKALEKHHSINIKKDGISRDEGFLSHGHGVIRQALFNFIAFLNDISKATEKKYILLFEEPELYLHPKILYNLRKSLYDLAEASSYQVLCATHSPLMIDISRKHCSLVRIVKLPRSEETVTYQVGGEVFTKDENKKIVMMLNKLNSHVCECFYADRVILVEGETEQIAFRTLLEKYFAKYEIFVLSAGSKTIIPFFQEVLTHFHISHFIIHDSDSPGKKSVWTINQKIWDGVELARNMGVSTKRYVMSRNFEEANGYIQEESKGKPLSAFEFADSLKKEDDKPCLRYLKYISGELEEVGEQSQVWLEAQLISD